MEKTLSSVSSLMLGQVGPRNTDVSPGFFALVKGIRRASSAMEQDEIIKKELDLLRQKLAQPNMGEKKMKELLVRLMYCEMLGHSASFGHITALKMAQQGSLNLKRVGYLAVGLFLDPNHELLLLLVNTVQKDLKSTNILDNCMALTAVSNLFGPDMIPAVMQQVIEKLKHRSSMVRKKAVMTLYSFFLKAPHLIHHMTDKFKEALCDREPAVMGAALNVYNRLITDNPSGHQSLVRPLVSILMQVSSHKLPITFEYHSVPAPWMQIKLLKMLAKLGHNNEYSSNLIYDVLEPMMQNILLREMVTYAVHYECISTIASIYPNKELISSAAKSISKFLKSSDNNLKYLGIEALGQLLAVDPECGDNHQMIVVDCLTNPDLTIRKKTLDLLYLMANDSNIEVICDLFMDCLPTLPETSDQQDLSSKLLKMAQKHYQSLEWFLQTVCQLCILADWPIENVVSITIDVIESERQSCGSSVSPTVVNAFLPYATSEISHESLLKLILWVLGEFSSQELSSLMVDDAFQTLLKICESEDEDWDTDTKLFILSAFGKIFSKSENLEMNLSKNLEWLLRDKEPEVRQRAAELIVLSSSSLRSKVETLKKHVQTGQYDWTLSFLDKFVSDALESGAAPYKPKQHRSVGESTTVHDVKLFSGLNFQPYAPPSTISRQSSSSQATTPKQEEDRGSSVASGGSSDPSSSQVRSQFTGESMSQLKVTGVKKVWGKSGYIRTEKKTEVMENITSPKEKSPPTSTSSPPPFRVASSSLPVQLNNVVATRSKDDGVVSEMGSSWKREEEEHEDPEMRQKKELAKALFGNTSQPSYKDSRRKTTEQNKSRTSHKQPVDLLSLNNDLDLTMVGKGSIDANQKGLLEESSSANMIPIDSSQTQSSSAEENSTTSLHQRKDIVGFDFVYSNPPVESDSLLDQISRDSSTSMGEDAHHLPVELAGYPSSKKFEHLCSDEMMMTTLCKVWKPDTLGLVFFLRNKHATQRMTEVKVSVNLPSSLKYTHTESRKHSMEIDSVNPQSTKSLFSCCTCSNPTINMTVNGEITYRDQSRMTKRLFFDILLPATDLLRPLSLTTEEFGRQWGQPSHDVRTQVKNVAKNLNSLMDRLSSNLPFYIVEVKGDESLAATSLLQSSNCLSHFKLQGTIMNVWIKTKNKMLSEVVAEIAIKAIEESQIG